MSSNPWARAERRRQEIRIAEPTMEQAVLHLQRTVVEADKRGVRSPTIEAIRKLVMFPVSGPVDEAASA